MVGVFDTLAKVLYVGPFRNAINEGAGDHYDLAIGSKFISTWDEWKNGSEHAKNRAIGRVTEDLRKIFEFRSLEINATPNNKTLKVFIDQKPYRLEELGAGLAQGCSTLFTDGCERRLDGRGHEGDSIGDSYVNL